MRKDCTVCARIVRRRNGVPAQMFPAKIHELAVDVHPIYPERRPLQHLPHRGALAAPDNQNTRCCFGHGHYGMDQRFVVDVFVRRRRLELPVQKKHPTIDRRIRDNHRVAEFCVTVYEDACDGITRARIRFRYFLDPFEFGCFSHSAANTVGHNRQVLVL